MLHLFFNLIYISKVNVNDNCTAYMFWLVQSLFVLISCLLVCGVDGNIFEEATNLLFKLFQIFWSV